MPATGRYTLMGSNGSPYSMKLRAILRYRRIPHDWVMRTTRTEAEVAHVKPRLIPMLRYPQGGDWHVDSTPIAYALEEQHPGQRSIVPDDPGHAFLSHLIEDMADEWGTKIMFLYRWARPVDIAYSSYWIADDFFPDAKGAERDAMAKSFAERQIGRMALVGCTEENAPVIEETYRRLLDILEPHVGLYDYLFGSRPALADFGLFGQLRPLGQDPTPLAIMRERAQRVESWVRQLDDASGIEGEWLPVGSEPPQAVVDLLRMVGEVYLPFLVANAAASGDGAGEFGIELLGQPYRQGTFKYQVKCLDDLRARFAALDEATRDRLRPVLTETGCWQPLAG